MSNDPKQNQPEKNPKPSHLPQKPSKTKKRKPKIIDPRRCVDPLIPYIINPRRTALLGHLPNLQWNAVQDATCYSVSLQAFEETIWQTKIAETQLVYLGASPLESGVEYTLLVEADTGTSSSDDAMSGSIAFRLLDDTKMQKIQTAMQQSKQIQEENQIHKTISLYRSYELRAEAIKLLETEIQQGHQVEGYHQILGELYSEVGLSLEAETAYLKAVELAEDTDDLGAQAAAAVGLGNVYVALKTQDEALYWLTQAKYGYEALADMEAVKVLEGMLATNFDWD